jgi:hypothetical protein
MSEEETNQNTEENKTIISIDGNDHVLEDMSDEQKTIIQHIADLDSKAKNAQFTLDQFNIARKAFMDMLKESL